MTNGAGDLVDRPREVRKGEGLDEAALSGFLAEAIGGAGPLTVQQFPGGHSNLTYLVRWGDEEMVLRRPPFGSRVKTAHDMGREHRILSRLWKAYAPAPRPIVHCDDDSVLGAPFYLMDRVTGLILRKDLPEGLTVTPQDARALCETMINALCQLHAVDLDATDLRGQGRPEGYVERQVTGWTKRYAASRTDEIADVEAAAAWLADNMPSSGAPALIHNDFKFDNVVLHPDQLTQLVGVLDWEMSTIGDPLMDVGTALSYWVQADDPALIQTFRFGPTTLPGMMTRREVAETYAEQSGRDLSDILFYYCFGLFKTAVVAQQIYFRFQQGTTTDPRFAQFIHGVRFLSAQATAAIERGHL